MNKRGQIYILAVIIMAFIIYTLFADTNIVKETIIEDDFEELATNYEVESAKFVNYLLDSGKTNTNEVRDAFRNFTTTFTAYSKTKNPQFGLLYLFDYSDRLYIGNYLDEDADVELTGVGTIEYTKGCLKQIPAGFKVAGSTLIVGGTKIQNINTNACIGDIITNTQGFNYGVTITIKDIDNTQPKYEALLSRGKPDIVIVGRETKQNIRKVYTKGRFINTIDITQ